MSPRPWSPRCSARSRSLTTSRGTPRAGPGGQHEGPVQLRRARRRPAEGGPGVHRRDQPGQPPPRPARGIRRADRGPPPNEERLAADLDRAGALLEDFRRARRELPDTRPIAKAAEAVGTHAALLARARDETAAARTALDAAIAEVDARTRQLRQAAAERRMPTADEQVDAIARAAAEFENAATQLHAERAKLAQAEEDLAAQTETIERRKLDMRPGRGGARRAGAAAAGPGRGVPHAGRDPAGGRPAGPGADPGDRAADRRGRPGVPRAGRAGPRRARQGHRRRGRTARPAAVAGRGGRAALRAGRAVRRVRPARPARAGRGHGRRALAGSGPLARPGPGRRGRWPRRWPRRRAAAGPGRGRARGPSPGRGRDPRRVRRRQPRRAAGDRGHAARTPRTGCRSR